MIRTSLSNLGIEMYKSGARGPITVPSSLAAQLGLWPAGLHQSGGPVYHLPLTGAGHSDGHLL